MASALQKATCNYESFLGVLRDITSEDNTVRLSAESILDNLKKDDPSLAINLLLHCLSCNPDEKARLQSAILVRNLFRTFIVQTSTDNAWTRLTVHEQALVKDQLMKCLENETDNLTRKNLCDSIADLAHGLVPNNEWLELVPKLIYMLQSENIGVLRSSLKILGEIASIIINELLDKMPAIEATVRRCLSHPDHVVRFECISFIAQIVDDTSRKVFRHLTFSVPAMMDSVISMCIADSSCCREAVQCIVTIAEANSLFLKSHLSLVCDKLYALALNENIDEDPRQTAVEAILCIADNKPKLALSVPNFVVRTAEVLMKFMLDIVNEKYAGWLDTGDEEKDEEQNLYDVGESGIDRLAKSFEEEESAAVISHIFQLVAQFLEHEEWQFKFVGIMTISQTAEYLPEEHLESYLEQIVTILLQGLQNQNSRVRFAACQAIGQLSLDHNPEFQERYHEQVLRALVVAMDDSQSRVQSHAIAAFVNFAEEVTKASLLPYADLLVEKLLYRINAQSTMLLRSQAVTAIAVISGVLEEKFMKYYNAVMPLMKDIIQHCLSKEDRTCRGKAIECISIIGFSIGQEQFLHDGQLAMVALIQILKEDLDEDDPVKVYIQEAMVRMCRSLKEHFAVYLPHIVPNLLQLLQTQPLFMDSNDVDDDEDMTLAFAQERTVGLKTCLIEDQERALHLIHTFVEVLQDKYEPYVEQTVTAVLQLIPFVLSDEVKTKSVAVMAEIIAAQNVICEKNKTDKSPVLTLLTMVVEEVFKFLRISSTSEYSIEIDTMIAQASGLNDCIKKAGPGILSDHMVTEIASQIFVLLGEATKRRSICIARKGDPELDEDEIDSLESDEEKEQTFRGALTEILGAVMRHHPQQFLIHNSNTCLKFIEENLNPQCCADDRALALYVCDDILAYLGNLGLQLWPQFMQRLLECLSDEEPVVLQAASFGVAQACKIPEFSSFVDNAAKRLVDLIQRLSSSKSKDSLAARDNAVAALGDCVRYHEANVSQAHEYLNIWLQYLPLKQDDDEGKRVHAELVTQIENSNAMILGADNCNVPHLIAVLASIYRTDFSDTALDQRIRLLVQKLGKSYILCIGSQLNEKQQQKVEHMFKDLEICENILVQ